MATVTVASYFTGGALVEVDPYAVNGLIDEVKAGNPDVYAMALRTDGPPPKMFGAGTEDLPAFTASGIDPATLLRFPYRQRHFVAAEANRERVFQLLELYADDPREEFGSDGLTAAVIRVRQWLGGKPLGGQELIAQIAGNARDSAARDKAAVDAMSDDDFEAMFNQGRINGRGR